MGAASGYNTARTSPKLVEKMAIVSPSLGAANWRSSLMNWSGRVGAFLALLPQLHSSTAVSSRGRQAERFMADPPGRSQI